MVDFNISRRTLGKGLAAAIVAAALPAGVSQQIARAIRTKIVNRLPYQHVLTVQYFRDSVADLYAQVKQLDGTALSRGDWAEIENEIDEALWRIRPAGLQILVEATVKDLMDGEFSIMEMNFGTVLIKGSDIVGCGPCLGRGRPRSVSELDLAREHLRKRQEDLARERRALEKPASFRNSPQVMKECIKDVLAALSWVWDAQERERGFRCGEICLTDQGPAQIVADMGAAYRVAPLLRQLLRQQSDFVILPDEMRRP